MSTKGPFENRSVWEGVVNDLRVDGEAAFRGGPFSK